jgi:MFS family permease
VQTRRRIAAVRTNVAALAGGGRGRILGTVAFGWFLGLGLRLAVPALVPYVRRSFGLDLATAGLLLSALWAGYALFQFPGGVAGDRFGERNVLVGSTVLVVLGAVACALAPTVPALFVGVVLLGTATGLYATTRFTVLTDVYAERAATALGVSSAAGNVGTALFPVGAGAVAAAVGWRAGFAAATPLFALAAVGLWFAVPERTSGNTSAVDDLSAETLGRIRDGVTGRRTLAYATTMLLMSFLYQGFTSFYPVYLVAAKGVDESVAAVLYGAFFAAGVLVQPVAGAIADALGGRRAAMGFVALTVVALVLVTRVQGLGPLLLLSVVASAQLGFWPIAQAAMIETLPADMEGTGFGLVRTVYLLLAASSPAVVGALADRGLFDGAFLFLAGCATLSLGVGLAFVRD